MDEISNYVLKSTFCLLGADWEEMPRILANRVGLLPPPNDRPGATASMLETHLNVQGGDTLFFRKQHFITLKCTLETYIGSAGCNPEQSF
jgi:hypothetical protein